MTLYCELANDFHSSLGSSAAFFLRFAFGLGATAS
jgi:hypothetical protein